MQRSMISSIGDFAARDAGFSRGRLDQSFDFGIGSGFAVFVVEIPAASGLLSVAAELDTACCSIRGCACPGLIEMLVFLLDAPVEIDAAHVVDGEDAHGHAEIGERAVDLRGRRAFFDQELRFAHVREHHAIADEAHGSCRPPRRLS